MRTLAVCAFARALTCVVGAQAETDVFMRAIGLAKRSYR
jgi:hypothetical protein